MICNIKYTSTKLVNLSILRDDGTLFALPKGDFELFLKVRVD